jgi:hypothetical protein
MRLADLATNVLSYGDNLDILRRYLPDAQLLAFEDTWHWGPSAEATYAYLTNTARHEGRVPDKVSAIIAALRAGIGENQIK